MTIDESMTTTSTDLTQGPPTNPAALVAIDGSELAIVNSIFQDLLLPQDSPLSLVNSTVLIHNTSFINISASSNGAFWAGDMQQLTMHSSSVIQTTGMQIVACWNTFA